MGTIKSSKEQSLVEGVLKPFKGKKKSKDSMHQDKNKKDKRLGLYFWWILVDEFIGEIKGLCLFSVWWSLKSLLQSLEETTERRRTAITTKRKKGNKISSEEILPTFDVTLVMKRDTLQEIVPGTKNPMKRTDIMLIPPKTMNRHIKYSKEIRMIQMKSMC